MNQQNRNNKNTREITGLILVALAVFLALTYFWPGAKTGALGVFFLRLGRGLFGPLAYALPLILIYFAVEIWFEKQRVFTRMRMLNVLVLSFLISAFLHIATIDLAQLADLAKNGVGEPKATLFLQKLWQVSADPSRVPHLAFAFPGGILGGLPAAGLQALAGQIGAYILIIMGMMIELILIFNLSVSGLMSGLLGSTKQVYQQVRDGAKREPVHTRQNLFSRFFEEDNEEDDVIMSDESHLNLEHPPVAQEYASSHFVVDEKGYHQRAEGEILQMKPRSKEELSTLSPAEMTRILHSSSPEKRSEDFSFPAETNSCQRHSMNRNSFSLIMPAAKHDLNEAEIPAEVVHPVKIEKILSASSTWENEEEERLLSESAQEEDWEPGMELYPAPARVDVAEMTNAGNVESTEEEIDARGLEDLQGSEIGERQLTRPGSLWEDRENGTETENTEELLTEELLTEEHLSAALNSSASATVRSSLSVEKNPIEAFGGQPSRGQLSSMHVQKNSSESILKSVLPQPYRFPPFELLRPETNTSSGNVTESVHQIAQKLEEALLSFGVKAKVINVTRGPSITRFELSPAPGVKVSKIQNLADDIALNLAAVSIRIEAPIPGKAAIGIEIPNKEPQMVGLRALLENESFKLATAPLLVALGRDIPGQPVYCDLRKMPHMMIAGATGSGKSVCINSILMSLLYHAHPDDVKLLLIDPKVVELKVYNGIPHLLAPVVTDPKKAANTLNWAVVEMDRRYNMFAEVGARDYSSYVEISKQRDLEHLPLILIIVDELADLMMTAANEVEGSIARLAAKARAAGIHLIIATQRPSVDVITGVIKANIPSRIAFAVSSQIDSRTILDSPGAEKLLGRGDMLYNPQSSPKPQRAQGAFVSDAEVEAVVSFLKAQNYTSYDQQFADRIVSTTAAGTSKDKDGEEQDELFDQAVEIILDAGYASVSILQRRMNIGYPRAARLIDSLESAGFIGPFEGSKPRKVRITREQWADRGEAEAESDV